MILGAADATRKVVNTQLSKMRSFLEPEATWALLDRHTIWTFSGMPILGVFRFVETVENKPFSTPRARPEQVRFGPRTRRLFRRPLQRTIRFKLFGTLAAESLNPFLQEKKGGSRKHQK